SASRSSTATNHLLSPRPDRAPSARSPSDTIRDRSSGGHQNSESSVTNRTPNPIRPPEVNRSVRPDRPPSQLLTAAASPRRSVCAPGGGIFTPTQNLGGQIMSRQTLKRMVAGALVVCAAGAMTWRAARATPPFRVLSNIILAGPIVFDVITAL